ncbi:sorbosone dehydrogenase family protein [Hyphomonas sp.]|uniref:PQQ-dependent sugar dehydrogenase n=1 Tax=Hyphomonas sp. TaxID=87 RepID=UPI0025B8A09B|nr:sorbosone dehydrogenase family protein [Hyphomonas sp.]
MKHLRLLPLALLALVSACASEETSPISIGFGPSPQLPAPEKKLLPTVKVAAAEAWTEGQMPAPADGYALTEFASGLNHPRWLYELPNGDILVAESNAPPKTDGGGIRGFFMKRAMARAGAGVPSADRISLLRDVDGDGVAETKTAYMTGLTSPFGMALIEDTLYIANAGEIVRVPYVTGETTNPARPEPFFTLPGGPINHHWTKNIVASADGTKLYAAVGSNSNVGENGLDAEIGRAAIWEIDIASAKGRLFATGLRNPVGMDFSADGTLYTVVNERDELGDNLVPDYLTSVKDGAFYGWPFSYYGQNVDTRVKPSDAGLIARAIAPDYALGAHTASLGLDVTDGKAPGMSAAFGPGAFIGQHGSWNRDPRSGYEVIFVPFGASGPEGEPRKVLTGFLDGDIARGRPVGVALDRRGGLLVADDVGNRIWRVTKR